MKIKPALYERAALQFPVKVVLSPGHIGKTSFSILHKVIDASTSDLLAESQRQFMYVDLITRKTVPLPELLCFATREPDPNAALHVQNVEPPEGAIRITKYVNHNDCDYWQHANQASYVKFCMNGAASACSQNKLKNFIGLFFSTRFPVLK